MIKRWYRVLRDVFTSFVGGLAQDAYADAEEAGKSLLTGFKEELAVAGFSILAIFLYRRYSERFRLFFRALARKLSWILDSRETRNLVRQANKRVEEDSVESVRRDEPDLLNLLEYHRVAAAADFEVPVSKLRKVPDLIVILIARTASNRLLSRKERRRMGASLRKLKAEAGQ